MSRILLAFPVLVLVLLPLCAGAAPPAPAPAADQGNMPLPATPGPLELVIFHNPTCHICQKIVALRPDMLRLNPDLRVILRDNTAAGAMNQANELRKQGKIPAETWGPATAVFLGDRWATDSGQTLRQQIHSLLQDRAEVDTSPWTGTAPGGLDLAQTRMMILENLRGIRPAGIARSGLSDGLSFPLLVSLLGLLAALVLAPGAPRVRVGLGLAYWAGAAVVLAGYGLGALGPVFAHRNVSLARAGSVAFYLVLGAGFLTVALSRWRAFRQTTLAPPAGEGEGGDAAEVRALQQPGALRNRVVGGLLLGLAVTFLALLVNPPGNTTILAQAWNLWDVQGRVLQLLGCYLGGATGPLLLTALLAGALTACRPLRRRGQENPAEYPFAAILFFLVVGAFLLSQAAVVTLAF